MTTWSSLFQGTNIYTDVFNIYPNLYNQVSSDMSFFYLFVDILRGSPSDVQILFPMFVLAVLPILCLIALLYALFMPIIQRSKKW